MVVVVVSGQLFELHVPNRLPEPNGRVRLIDSSEIVRHRAFISSRPKDLLWS
jgi:hypothetical protein